MSTKYNIEHIIEELNNSNHTKFINPLEYRQLKNKININKYNVFAPFNDCSKVIVYKIIPNIKLLKLSSAEEIRHQEILKCMFELGIKEDMYGDIIIKDNNAYIYVLDNIAEYILQNIKDYNKHINNLNEVPLEELNNYEIPFIDKEISVSSLRIDNIISSLIGISRKDIIDKFKNKEVILNYEIATKYTTNLQENDIFSIRRYGKFKFSSIKKETKKGGYIIIIKKYK